LLFFAPILAPAGADSSTVAAAIAPSSAPPASIAPSPAPSGSLAPAPSPPEPDPSEPPELRQMQEQMERISIQMRASQVKLRHTILALLTPVERATVATVIGELAIAPDPDVTAAARRIDAVLSPAQRQAVLGAISAAELEREKLFADMVGQSQTIASQYGGGGGPALPTLAPHVPASAPAAGGQGMTAFAMPGTAMVHEMAPNLTAGGALIGLLVSPSWMGTSPAPTIIRRSAPAAGAGPR
jgi:hypothetical protein